MGCGIELGISLRHRPGATGAVESDGGPAATVLITDVDKQGVVVVFHPDPVMGVALLMQTADRPSDEGVGATNEVQRPRGASGRCTVPLLLSVMPPCCAVCPGIGRSGDDICSRSNDWAAGQGARGGWLGGQNSRPGSLGLMMPTLWPSGSSTIA